MKSQFYEGALWKNELEGRLMPMLKKYEAVLVGAELLAAFSRNRA